MRTALTVAWTVVFVAGGLALATGVATAIIAAAP